VVWPVWREAAECGAHLVLDPRRTPVHG